jgi:hypothetical protein
MRTAKYLMSGSAKLEDHSKEKDQQNKQVQIFHVSVTTENRCMQIFIFSDFYLQRCRR